MQLPSEARVVALAVNFSELVGQLRQETGPAKLVLPNASFFPDTFEPSARGVQRLLTRMQTHASLLDVPVEVTVHDESEDHSQGACGSGACAPKAKADQLGRLQLEGDLWRLNLTRGELGHAVGLTTLLCRSLGVVLLEETRKEGTPSLAHRADLSELAAVQLGFGVLLLEGSHVYSKSCGGPQIARLTALDPGELAVVQALYAHANKLPLKAVYPWLSATQSSLLSEADDLVRANPILAAWVTQGRASAASGLRLKPPKPRLFGWLQPKSRPSDERLAEALLDGTLLEDPTLQSFAMPRRLPTTTEKKRPNDELSRLVEEALNEVRS